MQFTAMGFFVARMAGSPHQAALDLGILGAARAIPVLLLSPLAGVVADRLPRRRVLFVTNATMASAALLLALLASAHRLELVGLVLLSALNSAANGVRLADASELGAAARRSRVRRQRRRAQLGRVQRAGGHRARARRCADRLDRRRRRVLLQCGRDARRRRRGHA